MVANIFKLFKILMCRASTLQLYTGDLLTGRKSGYQVPPLSFPTQPAQKDGRNRAPLKFTRTELVTIITRS